MLKQKESHIGTATLEDVALLADVPLEQVNNGLTNGYSAPTASR